MQLSADDANFSSCIATDELALCGIASIIKLCDDCQGGGSNDKKEEEDGNVTMN
jgi:hypothetical protein